jgi:D-xylose transport system substrate-binding protein
VSSRNSPTPGRTVVVAAVAAAILLAAVVSSRPAAASRMATVSAGPVALLLPNKSNPRWQQDAGAFINRLQKLVPKAHYVVLNAHGSETNQIQEARTAVANGAKILVVAPVNPGPAGAIVPIAQSKKAVVIAYDAPIEAKKLDLFVGFDPEAIGALQGAFMAAHAPRKARLVYINGPSDDDVAVGQYDGYSHVLQPKVQRHRLSIAGNYWTTEWSSAYAKADMIDALFRNHDQIQGVVAANDTLAAGVISALGQAHIRHNLRLTGADATLSGLRAIVRGSQSMTVYKPISLEANAAAEAVAALLSHTPIPGIFNYQFKMSAGEVRSAIFQPELVTAAKLSRTVLKDHFVTRRQLCGGMQALCRRDHI